MINFIDENNNNSFENNKKLDSNISLDILLEQEIEKIKESKYKAQKYIKVCNGMISNYNKKIKVAEERFEFIDNTVKMNIMTWLKEAIDEETISVNLLEQDSTHIYYRLPMSKIIIKKQQIKIKDMYKLVSWINKNCPEYIVDEKLKEKELIDSLSIKDKDIVYNKTGEIVSAYFYLTDLELTIKEL